MCSHFTACHCAVVSAPLSSSSIVYCIEDILQLAGESEEAQAEGGQHGQVIVVVIAAAALALAATVTVAATTVAAVAAVAAVAVVAAA